mgnify:CR=1 FL=1
MRRALRFAVLLALAGVATRAQETAPEKEKAKDTGATGGLTEEEFKALHDLTDRKPPAPKGTRRRRRG